MNLLILYFVSILAITTTDRCFSDTMDLSISSYKLRVGKIVSIKCSYSAPEGEHYEKISIFKDNRTIYSAEDNNDNRETEYMKDIGVKIKDYIAHNYIELIVKKLTPKADGYYYCSGELNRDNKKVEIISAKKYLKLMISSGIDGFNASDRLRVGDNLNASSEYGVSTSDTFRRLSLLKDDMSFCDDLVDSCEEYAQTLCSLNKENNSNSVLGHKSILKFKENGIWFSMIANVDKGCEFLYECRLLCFDEKRVLLVTAKESKFLTVNGDYLNGEDLNGEDLNGDDTIGEYRQSAEKYMTVITDTGIDSFNASDRVRIGDNLTLECEYSVSANDTFEELSFHKDNHHICSAKEGDNSDHQSCTSASVLHRKSIVMWKENENIWAIMIANVDQSFAGLYECRLSYMKQNWSSATVSKTTFVVVNGDDLNDDHEWRR